MPAAAAGAAEADTDGAEVDEPPAGAGVPPAAGGVPPPAAGGVPPPAAGGVPPPAAGGVPPPPAGGVPPPPLVSPAGAAAVVNVTTVSPGAMNPLTVPAAVSAGDAMRNAADGWTVIAETVMPACGVSVIVWIPANGYATGRLQLPAGTVTVSAPWVVPGAVPRGPAIVNVPDVPAGPALQTFRRPGAASTFVNVATVSPEPMANVAVLPMKSLPDAENERPSDSEMEANATPGVGASVIDTVELVRNRVGSRMQCVVPSPATTASGAPPLTVNMNVEPSRAGEPATLQIFSCDVLLVNVTIDSFETSFTAAGRTATVAFASASDDHMILASVGSAVMLVTNVAAPCSVMSTCPAGAKIGLLQPLTGKVTVCEKPIPPRTSNENDCPSRPAPVTCRLQISTYPWTSTLGNVTIVVLATPPAVTATVAVRPDRLALRRSSFIAPGAVVLMSLTAVKSASLKPFASIVGVSETVAAPAGTSIGAEHSPTSTLIDALSFTLNANEPVTAGDPAALHTSTKPVPSANAGTANTAAPISPTRTASIFAIPFPLSERGVAQSAAASRNQLHRLVPAGVPAADRFYVAPVRADGQRLDAWRLACGAVIGSLPHQDPEDPSRIWRQMLGRASASLRGHISSAARRTSRCIDMISPREVRRACLRRSVAVRRQYAHDRPERPGVARPVGTPVDARRWALGAFDGRSDGRRRRRRHWHRADRRPARQPRARVERRGQQRRHVGRRGAR